MTDARSSTARHEHISSIFLEVCELPHSERDAFLRQRCDGDDQLRIEVLELLEHDEGHAAVDRPLIDTGGLAKVFDADHAPRPARIGRYQILGVLGAGGMGMVYRARQENPDRIVALKMMHPGVASPTLIRRFELEARLLGRLHHPGIAQIHEAGTVDAGFGAQPFFAMEMVEGLPLLDFAQARHLDIRQRLQLLVGVCDAVHHAHQKGVVHRDLKPGNILVQDDPTANATAGDASPWLPKILDFGIARVIDPDFRSATLQTDIGQMIGTLPYMSPEQVSGNPHEVDVRSDVYALGVIGYELLTGRLPVDVKNESVVEAAQRIQTAPIQRLSTMDKALRGDVETIICKALDKDKSHRYQSASELAEDIRRYLRHEPIAARPPSAIYQFRMFARRNRALVIGTAVAILLLLLAVIGTGYGFLAARQQRDQAIRAAEKAQAVREFFLGILTTPAPGVSGRDVKVVDALEQAEAGVATAFPDQPELRGDVHEEMAITLVRLGEYAQAEHHAREALRIRRETLGELNADTITAMNNLAQIILQPGGMRRKEQAEEAQLLLDHAIGLLKTLHGGDSEQLIEPLNNRAAVAFNAGRLDEAESFVHTALDLSIRFRGERSQSVLAGRQNLAMLAAQRGHTEQAEQELRRVVQLATELNGDRSPATLNAKKPLAAALRDLKRFDEAERIYRETIPIVDEVMGPTHGEAIVWRNDFGYLLSAQKRYEESAEVYGDALRLAEQRLEPDAFLTLVIHNSLAQALMESGRYNEAEPHMRMCLDGLNNLRGPTDSGTLRVAYLLVEILLRLGRAEDALALAQSSLDTASSAFDADSTVLAVLRSGVAQSLLALGRTDESKSAVEQCLRACGPMSSDEHFTTARAIKALAEQCDAASWHDQASSLRALVDGARVPAKSE